MAYSLTFLLRQPYSQKHTSGAQLIFLKKLLVGCLASSIFSIGTRRIPLCSVSECQEVVSRAAFFFLAGAHLSSKSKSW